MPANPAVRVGILVFIALIVFTAVAVFLTGYRLRTAGYPIIVTFSDALGLTQGSEVRMAGVTIGAVDRIWLNEDQQAVMQLLINDTYRIPVGSRFILRIGLLIGDKYIDIVPNRGVDRYYQRCAEIRGEVPPRVEDLVPQAQRVLAGLEQTTTNINEVLGSEEFQQRLNRTLVNLESATARLDQTMVVVQRTVGAQQDDVEIIIGNVRVASENLRAFSRELAQVANVGDLRQDLAGTLAAARRSAESLERSVTSLEALVTDPELQEDVRETVRGAREAVEEARETIGRFGGIFGGGEGAEIGPKVNFRQPTLDLLFSPADDVRLDAYATIPQRGDRFLRLGIYDLGGGNKGILQLGRSLSDNADLRYGIYASKLGIGYDHAFSDRVFGTANLYDLDDVRLDLQGGYRLNEDLGLLFGVDRLFKDNQLTLGVRFTR